MKTTFGEYIRILRKDKGLTLIELAEKLKLDSANLSKIETGKREFNEKRLERLASEFNLDMEKLKIEYFADQFAKKIYTNNCSIETLMVAEEKVKHLRNANIKPVKIKF